MGNPALCCRPRAAEIQPIWRAAVVATLVGDAGTFAQYKNKGIGSRMKSTKFWGTFAARDSSKVHDAITFLMGGRVLESVVSDNMTTLRVVRHIRF